MAHQIKTPRIAFILAGGGGRRMGGVNKGDLLLGDRRLIDHVLQRLSPQVDRVVISGQHDYRTGLPVVNDRDDGPRGPAAGLWATLSWIETNAPDADGFLTAPVDGPFAPSDLFIKLTAHGGSAIACAESGAHPTFAYWRCRALRAALNRAPKNDGLALKELADKVRAERVLFEDAAAFFNINTPVDLARAEARLKA